jgi:hypothetical protein
MTRRGNPSASREMDRPVIQGQTAPPVCAGCGRPFARTRAQRKFCRPSCRHLGEPVQLLLFP